MKSPRYALITQGIFTGYTALLIEPGRCLRVNGFILNLPSDYYVVLS